MFFCRFCDFRTNKLRDHLNHCKFHSNLSSDFFCGFKRCEKFFKFEASLRSHLLRTHNFRFKYVNTPSEQKLVARVANREAKYTCSLPICKKEFDYHSTLSKHMKSHIKNGVKIVCPFQDCIKAYDKVSSFTSHVSKNHMLSEILPNIDVVNNTTIPNEYDSPSEDHIQIEDCFDGSGVDECGAEMVNLFEDGHEEQSTNDLFLKHSAEFFLKLEGRFLIPVETIQYIVSQTYSIHNIGQEVVKNNLLERLCKHNITRHQASDIIDQTFHSDPFSQIQSSLGTSFKRRTFYEKNFSYVMPVQVRLGDENIKNNFFHYVPLQQTIAKLFENKSLSHELQSINEINTVTLKDFTDGSVFKNNLFFKENPEGLRFILYQDSFEIVNPLGSAKTKYKILAVYLSIGNFPDYIRSHVNSVQLVALCREKLFDHRKVYGRIVRDLKKIETDGVKLSSGKIIKGSLVFIAGDNLGSHALGGFVENFSTSSHFCRYCLMQRKEFLAPDSALRTYENRTIASYQKIIDLIKNEQERQLLDETAEKFDHQGIKFNSEFNHLNYYHVCAPGLPPCLAHDIFEGILAFDLCLYIKDLVKKKWFSYEVLNKRINSFQYSMVDQRDKPCTVSANANKITGGAWQLWTFLRLLPLLIEDKICDVHDSNWRCIILLTEIIEIVCAPEIHKSVISYLQQLISEYIHLRQQLTKPLRPKHHFLTHYPQLILQFGPLMKAWTMRFESKHPFFKRVVRSIKNFRNITRSLSVKHELHQSFVRSGGDIRSEIEMKRNTNLRPELYNEKIQAIFNNARMSHDIQECDKIIVRGVLYQKGNALFVACEGYQYNIQVGRIILLLCDEVNVSIIVEVLETIFEPHLRAYKLGKFLRYECLDLKSLPSTECLNVYNMGTFLCVKPNYGLVGQKL